MGAGHQMPIKCQMFPMYLNIQFFPHFNQTVHGGGRLNPPDIPDLYFDLSSPIVVYCCLLLSPVVYCCLLLPTVAYCCLLLPTVVQCAHFFYPHTRVVFNNVKIVLCSCCGESLSQRKRREGPPVPFLSLPTPSFPPFYYIC